MTGHGSNLGNVPIRFEQAADAFVTKVVEVQVLDAEITANTAEGRADRAPIVGEDEPGGAAQPLSLLADHACSVETGISHQRDNLVIAGLLAGVLTLANA